MPRKCRPPEERVQDILLKATPKAARLLVRMMDEEEVSNGYRVECAKEVLSRVFGRAGTPMAGAKPQVEVIFRGEGQKKEG